MSQLGLTVIVGVLLIVFVFGLVVWLLVMNNTRRISHRLELAEMKLLRDREVVHAEREARQQTMQQIGRELHDNLGQLLTVVQIAVEYVHVERPDPRLDEVLHTLEHSIEEVRHLGRSFHADMWVQRSFPDAVAAEVARLGRAGVPHVHLHQEGEWPELAPEEKTILFRVYQELINNALKHGRHGGIDVRLIGGPMATLVVSDHGPGFALNAASVTNGLANVRHRCELVGFRAELATAPGEGCTWRIVRT